MGKIMRNRPALELHIPRPASRPGDVAGFNHLRLSAAGEVRRPAAAAPEEEIRDLPFSLIRVLDDEGSAVGPWHPQLSTEKLIAGLRAMLLTRIFDERLFRAHRQGKTSFYMKSTGEEAIGAAQSLVLEREDMCFPTYRVLSWLMARDYPLVDLINQIFSNERDPLQGRQLPRVRTHKWDSHGGSDVIQALRQQERGFERVLVE
ncbi:thiamine pyrophosphate-dependent enzyme [Sphingomonas sp. SRS2]|uniref:thiamine pyrophosphate-dependent enzyme n=1 Tax=Sphingomonas sp. SRS2 TaxID=133190 RepID=UPI000695EC31|nr:thiamine pyrophosphate-dependent enzyme [Sphingomonas sp. SRS2]